MILDTEKDCDNYLHINNLKARKVVLTLVEEDNFADVWRLMNEDTSKYTWRRLNPTKKQARLDYLLASESTVSFVTDSDIVLGYRTDHSGIILKLTLQKLEKGRSYFKFNDTLLKDKKYIEKLKI